MKKFTTFCEFFEIANPPRGTQPVANPQQGVHSQLQSTAKKSIPVNHLIASQDIVATVGSPGMLFMGFADPKMVNAIIADPNDHTITQTIPTKNIKAVIRGGQRIDVEKINLSDFPYLGGS